MDKEDCMHENVDYESGYDDGTGYGFGDSSGGGFDSGSGEGHGVSFGNPIEYGYGCGCVDDNEFGDHGLGDGTGYG